MQVRSYQQPETFQAPDPLRNAWTVLLSRLSWHYFITLTWRTPAGPEQIVRDFRTMLSSWSGDTAIGRGLASRTGRGRLCGWWANRRRRGQDQPVYVLGIEPHRSGRLHAHALVRFPACFGEVRFAYAAKLWFKWHGGSKFELPRTTEDVASYCSKYITKPGCDLLLSPSFDAPSLCASA